MSGVAKKLMSASGGVAGGGFTAIEDVFSTYLYTASAPSQTITNGIDLAGEGGLVWFKKRNGATDHCLIDTVRGVGNGLVSNGTAANSFEDDTLQSFLSDGFTLGDDTKVNSYTSTDTYASWTFRKAPRFFDVVTYTGDGVAGRAVSHNLGSAPGCIIVKRTDDARNWSVFHRSTTATHRLLLNDTAAASDDANYWDDTEPTETEFTLGTQLNVNASGGTYVAYLFAHDPLGPSGDGSDGLIACGSYAGGTAGEYETVNLGWEPQWLLIKRSDSAESWLVLDNMRGLVTGGEDRYLLPNSGAAEGPDTIAEVTPTGFRVLNRTFPPANYIYIAIRRGPMRAPESGTEVFDVSTYTGNNATSRDFNSSTGVVDLAFRMRRDVDGGNASWICPRLTERVMRPNLTNAEEPSADADINFDDMSGYYVSGTGPLNFGWNVSGSTQVNWLWKRAPKFFDVVAYTGTGTERQVPHNLGVTPEMLIIKRRDGTNEWFVHHTGLPSWGRVLMLQSTGTDVGGDTGGNLPTETGFPVNASANVNGTGATYIAYLFSTLAGISKVGSYTGNGTSQTINCGFTSSARFILIKRTDSTGDWYVWDTARGIVAANDPHLSLNTTAAEVTTDDSIDPDSSGFIVNQVAATNINVSAASYIFYAVS